MKINKIIIMGLMTLSSVNVFAEWRERWLVWDCLIGLHGFDEANAANKEFARIYEQKKYQSNWICLKAEDVFSPESVELYYDTKNEKLYIKANSYNFEAHFSYIQLLDFNKKLIKEISLENFTCIDLSKMDFVFVKYYNIKHTL